MGNCLKKNIVKPFDPKDAGFGKRPNSGEQAEMIRNLKDEGKEARIAGGGLSFVVDFTESKKGKKPSLASRKACDRKETHADESLPTYSVEEKALMADILRENQLREKTQKARSVDMKIYDAKRRRLLRDAEAAAIRKQRLVFGENYQLVPHVDKRIEEVYDITTAGSAVHCAAKCSRSQSCKAVNFRLGTGDCELSAVCFDYFSGNNFSGWTAITWKDYPDCPSLPVPQNGWLDYSCGIEGAEVFVGCYTSYTLCGVGSCPKSTLTCQSDGSWGNVNLPYCKTARYGVITHHGVSGSITSPNYPYNYSDFDVREWAIYVPTAEKLRLTFYAMTLEQNYDTVTVHDGCDETAPILGVFTGTAMPGPLTSCGSSLYVNFTADYSIVFSGFQAVWSVV